MTIPVSAEESLRRDCVFSICTLVTDTIQYQQMVASFQEHGFDGPDCEYLFLDNSATNRYDAFSGINFLLRAAKGRFIIVCHQDILLFDDKDTLLRALDNLSKLDSAWGVLGNAGFTTNHELAIRITDPYGQDKKQGDLPVEVTGLDENFLLINAECRLSLSNKVTGFHLYGIDIYLVANMLGYTAYVIDFHVHHLGGRSVSTRNQTIRTELAASRFRLANTYTKKMKSRWVGNTSAQFFLTGSPFLNHVVNSKIAKKVLKRLKLFRAS